MNPKYKEKICKELIQMLEPWIIISMEDSDWIIQMVVQLRNTCDLRICVDMRNLNVVCVHDPFSTPFIDEVMKNVGGDKVYSFMDGFSSYH